MRVIPYRKKYDDQIIELNKLIIPTWYKKRGKHLEKSNWESLTSKERYIHGGPWYDHETLKIHIKNFEHIGKIDLLLNDTEELIGLIEYHFSKTILHLDWILIHPYYQKKGFGSKLLDHLAKTAKKNKLDQINTEPEEDVSKFYEKNGFNYIDPYYRYEIVKNEKFPNKFTEVGLKEISFDNRIGESQHSDKYLEYLFGNSIEFCDLFDEKYPLYIFEKNEYSLILRSIPGFPNIASLFISDLEKSFSKTMIMQIGVDKSAYFTYSQKLETSLKLSRIIENLQKQL